MEWTCIIKLLLCCRNCYLTLAWNIYKYFLWSRSQYPSWLTHRRVVFLWKQNMKIEGFRNVRINFYGCLCNLQTADELCMTSFVYLRSNIVTIMIFFYASISTKYLKILSRLIQWYLQTCHAKFASTFLQSAITISIMLN